MSDPKFTIADPKDLPASGFAPGVRISAIVSVNERAKRILFTDQFSDAVLLVGPDDRTAASIPVHTVYLKTASEPFAAMFSETWDKKQPIRIKDSDEASMCSLLRWLYCEEFVFAEGKLSDVLKVAHMYMVDSVNTFVVNNFEDFAQEVRLIPQLLTFSFDCDDSVMKEKCITAITENVPAFLEGDLLMGVSREMIGAIIRGIAEQADPLFLFHWIMEWVEKECCRRKIPPTTKNMRIMIDPFIHRIPFLSMSMEDFADYPCSSGILTYEEQATILRILAGASVSSHFVAQSSDPEFEIVKPDLFIGSMTAKCVIQAHESEIIFQTCKLMTPALSVMFDITIPVEECVLFYYDGPITSAADELITVFIKVTPMSAQRVMDKVMNSVLEFDTSRYNFDPNHANEKYAYLMFSSSDPEFAGTIKSYPEDRLIVWNRDEAVAVYNKIIN